MFSVHLKKALLKARSLSLRLPLFHYSLLVQLNGWYCVFDWNTAMFYSIWMTTVRSQKFIHFPRKHYRHLWCAFSSKFSINIAWQTRSKTIEYVVENFGGTATWNSESKSAKWKRQHSREKAAAKHLEKSKCRSVYILCTKKCGCIRNTHECDRECFEIPECVSIPDSFENSPRKKHLMIIERLIIYLGRKSKWQNDRVVYLLSVAVIVCLVYDSPHTIRKSLENVRCVRIFIIFLWENMSSFINEPTLFMHYLVDKRNLPSTAHVYTLWIR